MATTVTALQFSASIDVASPLDAPRVLVVDDEWTNRELLREMLLRQGCEPLLVDSGEQALAQLQTDAPDLVLLDVNMSPMNGFEVLQQIRARHRDSEIPVIMVTADADRNTIISAFRQGANDYVTKPLDPELTLARISLQLRLRRSQLELQRSQERYRMAAQGSRIGLWDWDIARRQLFVSSRWKEMLGFADHEFVSTEEAWYERVHPQDRELFRQLLRTRQPHEPERFECELRMRHRDESYRWMQCSGIVQADTAGRPRRLAGSLADITEGKVRDVLTGLPNRLLFEERLEAALHKSTRSGRQCAVLFLDLDKFKLVNDSLGHDAGDLLLCSVARRLEQILRPASAATASFESAEVARHGGDEFTVLLDGLVDRAAAEHLAARIIHALVEPFQLGVHEATIGCSIGITFGDANLLSPADAIREADTAMYFAKTAGRGQYRVYDPEMQSLAAARLALEGDVRHALKHEQFYVVFQPIILVATGEIDGFEALCRWQHPRGEIVGPDVFIPVLESLGLIAELGRFVLGAAGRQVREWNRQFGRERPYTVTVNCSTREFGKGSFHRELLQHIAQQGFDPRTIRLEVTESTLMENPEATRQFISVLRAHGVGVGLDDFGTGYSSLSYLHRLPLDLLKIDKSFIRNIRRGNESCEIVRTILSLAQGLDLDVVAEGIETPQQHELLRDLGCKHAQGYFYARPETAAAITERLATGWRLDPQAGPAAQNCDSLARIDELLALPGVGSRSRTGMISTPVKSHR